MEKTRPPIVVILGHVDHGKTTILDYIRESKVAEKESGGITQHIGAYQVEQNGKKITFLDTPGHEAFSALRSRGADVADVAVMVVAGDDGIKQQTKEVIELLKETNIPYVIAINKMDKEGANSQRVKTELADHEVLVEEWGGKIPAMEVSAKTGAGMDELLDMILLVSELEDLKAEADKPAEGVVIESKLDNQKGLVATLLVKSGTLKKGDIVVSSTSTCKVRTLEDFMAAKLDEAGPSTAVVTTGWDSSPHLGQDFQAVGSASEAKKLVKKNIDLAPPALFVSEQGGINTEKRYINMVIKADVFSSLEAIDKALQTIKSEEVGYNVVSSGVGNISEGDIKSVQNNGGRVYGFRVAVESSVEGIAQRVGIEYETFDIIYEMIEKIKKDISELLDPEIKKNPLGKMKVLAVFKTTDKTQIIGGKVSSGKIKRGAQVDVIRNGDIHVTGRISQLQHNKADVQEVTEGLECGIKFEGPEDIKEGDVLEVYEEEKIYRSL